jgi:beta-glucosidase
MSVSENTKDDIYTVTVTVTNTGLVAAKESVQVYLQQPYIQGGVEKASAELVGYGKTALLQPGESETVAIPVTARDLAYWDEFTHRFTTPAEAYRLQVGSTSVDLRGEAAVRVGRAQVFAD